MRIFVTGGTGLVGRRLVVRLHERGDEVVVLSRRPDAARGLLGAAVQVVAGDPTTAGPWMDAVGTCAAVVHLAGANVFARRWNKAFQHLLYTSRIEGTRHVVAAIRRHSAGGPRLLVNASAIGYYGPHGDEELTEDSPPGTDFLARLCVDWEQAAQAVEEAGVRCVRVRVGVVLDREGGALAKMLTPFKLFAGGPIGNGRQYVSWIHHDDLVGLFLLALDNAEARGPLNGTAPLPVTNRDFSSALGRALHRPALLPTPRLVLRLALGGAADLVATGQRVLPRRAEQLGYTFRYPTVDAALGAILG